MTDERPQECRVGRRAPAALRLPWWRPGLLGIPLASALLAVVAHAQFSRGGSPGAPGMRRGVVHLDQGSGALLLLPTIQAAVDAAADGDTILLSDGLFLGPGNHGIVVAGKNVVIRSRNGPRACTIDCQDSGRGFLFRGPEVTSATLLWGVTITRGNPAISDEFGSGGAILVKDKSWPTIEDCIVVGNTGRTGGGIVVHPDTTAPAPAGLTRITGCTVVDNTAWFGGGGGLYAGHARIERCTVRGNRAQQRGGGIQCFNGVAIRSTLVADNSSSASTGGGVHVSGSGSRISGCTIAFNAAPGGTGGGVQAQISDVLCENSILWGNTAGGDGDQLYSQNSFFVAQPTISYCTVEQGDEGVAADNAQGLPILVSILSADPAFADPGLGEYRLSLLSPCREAGDPAFLPLANEGDIDNQPRLDGVVDMGSDELWAGMALTLPAPGRAGERNELCASGAAAGDLVAFFYGTEAGSFELSFAPCPGLALGLQDATYAGHAFAGADGRALHAGLVPQAASGERLYFQALGFHPAPALPCTLSNLVGFSFP